MQFNIQIGTKALITTDCWFVAPDGQLYNSVFWTVNGIFNDKDTLGIETNAKSTNWYAVIGNMTIAGCQIHYAIKTEKCNFEPAPNYASDAANGIKEFLAPCRIYNADT